MKQQPVSDPPFWEDRLAKAKANKQIHWSVYLCGELMWNKMQEAHREILLREIEPGMKVLDAGCGYGRMARFFPPAYYTGVDISPDLLEIAHTDFPMHRFILGNLKELPFKNLEFDVAFCISIKGMIVGNLGGQEWDKIQIELKRVAKKVLLLEYGDITDFRNYTIV